MPRPVGGGGPWRALLKPPLPIASSTRGRSRSAAACVVGLMLGLAACTGEVGDKTGGGNQPSSPGTAGSGAGGTSASGTGNSSGVGARGGTVGAAGGGGARGARNTPRATSRGGTGGARA